MSSVKNSQPSGKKPEISDEGKAQLYYGAIFGQFGVISGIEIIEKCLAQAVAAKPEDAPIPLTGQSAAIWHKAQENAFRHVLEMISVGPEVRQLALV